MYLCPIKRPRHVHLYKSVLIIQYCREAAHELEFLGDIDWSTVPGAQNFFPSDAVGNALGTTAGELVT